MKGLSILITPIGRKSTDQILKDVRIKSLYVGRERKCFSQAHRINSVNCWYRFGQANREEINLFNFAVVPHNGVLGLDSMSNLYTTHTRV
jgi:hypothetical protein